MSALEGLRAGWRAHRWAVMLVGVALCVRLWGIGESLWYDELWSTTFFLKSPAAVWQLYLDDVHGPFYTVLMYGWISVFGDGEVAVRIPPLVFGLGTLVLAYRLMLEWFGRAEASWSLFFMSVSPVLIWYSQEARHYSAATFLLLLCVFALHRLSQGRATTRWTIVYVGAALCLALSHFIVAAYVGLAFVGALLGFIQPRRRVALSSAAVIGIYLIVVAVKVRLGTLPTGLGYLRAFNGFELWMLLFQWLGTGNAIVPIPIAANPAASQGIAVYADRPWALAPSIALVGVFGAGIASNVWRPGPQRQAALRIIVMLFFLPAVLWSLTIAGYANVYIERTAVVLMPYFACVLGWGAARPQSWRSRTMVQAALVGVALASFAAYQLRPLTWTVYKQNPDWRSLTRYLWAEGEHQWLVLSGSPPLSELSFYAGERVLPISVHDEEQLPTLLEENPRGEFFFVVNRSWSGNTRSVLVRLRDTRNLCVTPERTFKALELYRVSHCVRGPG